MKLFISLDSPYRWVMLNQQHQVKDSGAIENFENYRIPKQVTQVIGVASGENIACHSVAIPGKRKRYAESALAYALEDRLTEDVEALHFKLLSWHPNGLAYAAVASKSQLSTWIEKFRNAGIDLDVIIPEYFLLPQHPKCEITIAKVNDEKFCVRLGKYQGLTLEREGFQYWWDGLDKSSSSFSVSDLDLAKALNREMGSDDQQDENNAYNLNHWDIGNDFSQWLSNAEVKDNLEEYNILQGQFAPSHNKRSANLVKVAAVVAIIGLVIYSAMQGYESRVLEARKTQLNSDMRSLFSRYFPDQPYLDRPRTQIAGLIETARLGKAKNTGFQVYLNAVSKVTPKFNAVVEEINYRDKDMVILCVVNDLSSLDTIKQAFNQLGSITAELLSSGARSGKVTGQFKLMSRS